MSHLTLENEPHAIGPHLVDERIPSPPRGRWWYVLRYHRPSQLVMRAIAMARRLARAFRLGLPSSRPALASRRETDALENLLVCRVAELEGHGPSYQPAGNRVCFLNREHVFGDTIDWKCLQIPAVSRLWKFHLHSHEFLLDLLADGEANDGANAFWRLVVDWIENNIPGDPRVFDDAWHPYCISRRLPIWMMAWAAHPPSSEFADVVSDSLLLQLTFLDGNLEWDLRGNHLLENLATLALGSVFFAGPAADRWGGRTARLLPRQLAEQILDDGEHF